MNELLRELTRGYGCRFAIQRIVIFFETQDQGLNPLGSGIGQGFFLHSSLLVSDETGEIAGLAAQDLYYRIEAPKAKAQVRERNAKESRRLGDESWIGWANRSLGFK